jgi:hypothetical protein
MDMAWYAQLAVRGNLGKVFLSKVSVTKNGLRHEEKLDWLPCCLGHYRNCPYCIFGFWNTFIAVEERVFSCWLLSCRKGNIIMNMSTKNSM